VALRSRKYCFCEQLDVCGLLFGSSLLGQRTLRGRRVAHVGERFIPASAGNKTRWPMPCRRRSVHPCRRREHIFQLFCVQFSRGSSLRAQGTRSGQDVSDGDIRFIPAGAGNTIYHKDRINNDAVHPCGRREHENSPVTVSGSPGSSLRAQGTRSFCYSR